MATAVKQVELETGTAVKSISDLKKQIKDLKSEIEQLGIGTDEYNEKTNTLILALEELNSVLKQATAGATALKGSYNALSYEMTELKKAYHATNDAAERADLANRINGINDKLKEMDANVGVFTRNVGNYLSAFEALGNKGMGSMITGMKGIKGAMDVLKAHPLIAIVAVAVTVLMKIVDAVKKNEAAMNQLKIAFAPLNAVMSVFQNVLEVVTNKIADLTVKLSGGLTKAIKTVVGWIAKGAEALGMDGVAGALNEIEQKMQESAKITKEDIRLQQLRRDVTKENAEAEVLIAKLRKQYEEAEADKAKQAELSAKIAAEEQKIRQRNYDLAKAEYEQIKLINSQTLSGTEDLDKENDAYAKMLQAESQLYVLTAEQKKTIKENVKEIQKAQTEVEKLVKQLNDWNSKYVADNQSLAEAKEALTKKYEQDLVLLKNNEEAKLLLKKKYDAEMADLDKKLADKQKKDAEQAIKDLIELTNTLMTQMIEEHTGNVLFSSVDKALRDAGLKILAQYAAGNINEEQTKILLKGLGIDEDAMNEAIALINLDKGFNALKEGLSTVADTMDSLGSSWSGVVDGMINTIGQVLVALNSSEKGFSKWGQVAAAACQMVGSMFSSLADEQDENTKEGFEQQKKYNIAAATMNMLAGIVSAWTSAMSPSNEYLTIWGLLAMGAAMSAMILGTGIAQIQKIQQQQFDSASSSASASSSGVAASITPPVQYSTAVQGASTEETMTEQRVYVLESDISNTQGRVSVAENEARY